MGGERSGSYQKKSCRWLPPTAPVAIADVPAIQPPLYALRRIWLLVRQATFAQDVVLENLTPNGIAPSINERDRVGSMEMCSECGLVSPPLGDHEATGVRIVHSRVIGKVSVPLPDS